MLDSQHCGSVGGGSVGPTIGFRPRLALGPMVDTGRVDPASAVDSRGRVHLHVESGDGKGSPPGSLGICPGRRTGPRLAVNPLVVTSRLTPEPRSPLRAGFCVSGFRCHRLLVQAWSEVRRRARMASRDWSGRNRRAEIPGSALAGRMTIPPRRVKRGVRATCAPCVRSGTPGTRLAP